MTRTRPQTISRRSFFKKSAGAAAALTVASRFEALAQGPPAAGAPMSSAAAGYGPLVAVPDRATGLPLLKLPEGFEYVSFGWTGDPMSDGRPTPGAHDGMAAFRDKDGLVRLVRNHELSGYGGAFATGMTYDPAAQGGTTTLVFDPDRGELVASYASVAGTIRNCAGGPTPWGSWLTCEETTEVNGTLRHGYVFEVPAQGTGTGVPLKAMGRFSHEAVAVDPATGIVYETEDATPSGFYRFVPTTPGTLTDGGTLQMLKIGAATLVTYGATAGTTWDDLSWVTIANPDPGPGEKPVVTQGIAAGGAQFERLEGAWYAEGKVYFVSTSGGPFRGQVFEYDPVAETLRLIFHSPDAATLDSPDNLCVSPRGGIVLCEDGSGDEYMHGLTTDGDIFPFALNNVVLDGHRGFTGNFRGSEWAGATFEPKNGNWLFANLQSPGLTVAITGPWRRGTL